MDVNDPGRWPPLLRAAAVAGTLLAVTVFGARVFVIEAELALLQRAEREEVELRAVFEQGQRHAANLGHYRTQLAEIEESFGTVLRRLSGTTEIPGLLADISRAGRSTGLQEQLFQPLEEVQQEFYAELPVNMRLRGGYHRFGAFVSEIAAIPRLVTLHDIHIRPGGGGAPPALVLELTAKTYRHLEDTRRAGASIGHRGLRRFEPWPCGGNFRAGGTARGIGPRRQRRLPAASRSSLPDRLIGPVHNAG